jgi:hypothetical protein
LDEGPGGAGRAFNKRENSRDAKKDGEENKQLSVNVFHCLFSCLEGAEKTGRLVFRVLRRALTTKPLGSHHSLHREFENFISPADNRFIFVG